MSNKLLTMENITLLYDDKSVLTDLSLTLSAREHIVLMGESGCGKTSLLRLIAGLIRPTSGKIVRTTDRIAMQFQEPRLLPNRTAAENINVVLSDRRTTLPEARAWLSRVGLADAADLYPDELSGGMAQRVSLARALAYRGDILLLDEPFRGLNAELREQIISLVLAEARHTALILVTHDPYEAERFSKKTIRL